MKFKKTTIIAGVLILTTTAFFLVSTKPPEKNEKSQTDTERFSIQPPQEKDVINNFFSLINEGKVSDAVNMLSSKATKDESQKQAWGVQFNSFEKISLTNIEQINPNQYKVTLNVKMKPEAINAIIPNYGFENGDNTRWISLERENGTFKISNISTGP